MMNDELLISPFPTSNFVLPALQKYGGMEIKNFKERLTNRKAMSTEVLTEKIWFKACKETDVPVDGGACVKYRQEQIAVFYFARNKEWYATQNQCPHKMEMILSRGMIGDTCGEPKVACPYHKQTFSLKTGENMNGDCYSIKTYNVKTADGYVYIDVSSIG